MMRTLLTAMALLLVPAIGGLLLTARQGVGEGGVYGRKTFTVAQLLASFSDRPNELKGRMVRVCGIVDTLALDRTQSTLPLLILAQPPNLSLAEQNAQEVVFADQRPAWNVRLLRAIPLLRRFVPPDIYVTAAREATYLVRIYRTGGSRSFGISGDVLQRVSDR